MYAADFGVKLYKRQALPFLYDKSISPFANSEYVKGHGDNRHIRCRDRRKKLVGIMFVPGYLILIVTKVNG